MFAKSGLMTAPCGVPSSVTIKRPCSSTPAVSHFAINLMIRRSPIRCSMKRISQDWLTLSKKDWTSQSSTQSISRSAAAPDHWSIVENAPPADPERERIQRLVLIALRSEPVAEAQELRLIDRRQDYHHRRLDDLVLQGGDAERSLPAIWLRNISSTRWLRSIRSCLDARMEIHEVLLEAFRVLGPCHLVDAGRGELLQPQEARPQNIDGEMMQERR